MPAKVSAPDRETNEARLIATFLGLCVFLAASATGHAHSDPWGDIHPAVGVEKGCFSIYFTSQVPDEVESYTDQRAALRMVFSSEGTLLAPRHAVASAPSDRTQNVGLYGARIPIGESAIVFEDDQAVRPGYLLEAPDGKLTRHRIPWPRDFRMTLDSVIAAADGLAMTGKEDEKILKLYWWPFGEDRPPTVAVIGVTATIYDFPVASNVVFAGGRFWVAFMKPRGDLLQLALWSWKPGEGKGREEILDSPADWNSHLSLAAIGDQLCLAYHCATKGSHYDSRIFTVFRKAR